MRRVAFLCILLYTVIDIIASPLDVLLANIALHGVALEAQPQAGPFSLVWRARLMVDVVFDGDCSGGSCAAG